MTQEQKHMPDSFKPSNFCSINRLMVEKEAINVELLKALKDHRKALWLAMDELCSAWLKGKKSYTKDQQKYMDFFQSELDKADAAILKAEGGAE